MFISLIPKKSSVKSMSNYLPISLATGTYKVISKVLSNRKEVLHDIDGNQFALINSKNILDNVVLANDCIDEYKRKKKKELGC